MSSAAGPPIRHDSLGESGCVGCGRCICWCPAGIDVTAELHALDVNPPATTEEPT
ncbi:hypothetical protein [Dactylosporangium sp. NPDC051484]|uniref:hypothetical protein n=1 Tax=Dactylosporangium sp. NPDC051484 TaxID=3154942 RepID=UPI00344E5BF4